MKRTLLAFSMLLVTAGAPNAGGLVTRHQSSLQHTVDAARTTTTRIGNSYSVSGSGVVTDVGGTGTADLNVGGLGTLTNGAQEDQFQPRPNQLLVMLLVSAILLLQVMQIMELELTQLHIPQVVQVTIVVVVLLVQLITTHTYHHRNKSRCWY